MLLGQGPPYSFSHNRYNAEQVNNCELHYIIADLISKLLSMMLYTILDTQMSNKKINQKDLRRSLLFLTTPDSKRELF